MSNTIYTDLEGNNKPAEPSSSLHTKLQTILTDNSLYAGDVIDHKIAQILQAFQEAGWIDTKKPITGDIHGVGVYEIERHESEDWDRLSGREFYDRFKAELDNSRWMKTGGDLLYGDVLEAARLAAGVSDD